MDHTNSWRFNGVLEVALVLLLLLGCTACALTAASWADMEGGPPDAIFGSRTPGWNTVMMVAHRSTRSCA